MVFDPDKELSDLLESLLHPKLKRISPGLERVERLLDALGNPHQKLPPVIHIAGTNGKGSTLAFVQSILEAAGKKVHKYSSPHLVTFRERIILAGDPISKAMLMPILHKIHYMQDEYPTTFFEATTVAAFLAFESVPADFVLLETGMGGRLDTTNVISKPLANIITPVGYDHQDFLGDTLTEIAGEKAGILRDNVPAFIARQQPEAMSSIVSHKADFYIAGDKWDYKIIDDNSWQFNIDEELMDLPIPALLGEHQVANAALAISCLNIVQPDINQNQIEQGLQNVNWAGRLQKVTIPALPDHIPVYLDGAHNSMAGSIVAKWSENNLPEKPVLVLAMKSDKDANSFIQQWQNKVTAIIATIIPDEEEYVMPEHLNDIAQSFDIKCENEHNIDTALRLAASYNRPIIICGSLYLVGAILAKN